MEVLASEYYFFDAWREDNGECFLEVLCGSVAMYTIKIRLSETEIAEFESDPKTMTRLARRILDNPHGFVDRRV
jgi:hypothetical protein